MSVKLQAVGQSLVDPLFGRVERGVRTVDGDAGGDQVE